MSLSKTAGEVTVYIASDGGLPSSSARKRCADIIPGTVSIAARWPRYHSSHSMTRDGSVRPLSLVKIIAASFRRRHLESNQNFVELVVLDARQDPDQFLDLSLGCDVDLVIALGMLSVAVRRAVLRHQDQRRGKGRFGGHEQVEE